MVNGSVSVVIPVYNNEKYIGEAVGSALSQSCAPLEIIVVDDGSTDGSAEAAAKAFPGVRRVTLPHSGVSRARNEGARAARGEYIAFLDADDLWEKDKLEKQLEAMRNNPEARIVLCRLRDFVSPDLSPEKRASYMLKGEKTGYHAGCMLIRKSDFLETGGFPEDRAIFESVEWFIKVREKGFTTIVLEELLMHRRIHENNTLQKDKKKIDEAYFSLIRDWLGKKGGG